MIRGRTGWSFSSNGSYLSHRSNGGEIARLRPALVWLESPTNPLLKILDIAGLSRVGREFGADVLLDNTFASPYCQRPLGCGHLAHVRGLAGQHP